jgi:hypothetical protein
VGTQIDKLNEARKKNKEKRKEKERKKILLQLNIFWTSREAKASSL